MKEYEAGGSSSNVTNTSGTSKKLKSPVTTAKVGSGGQFKSKEFIEDDDSSSDSDNDKVGNQCYLHILTIYKFQFFLMLSEAKTCSNT